MTPERIRFLYSQRLHILKDGADSLAALHPERFHDARKMRGDRDEPGATGPDSERWEELDRRDLVAGAAGGRSLHRTVVTTDAGLGKTYNLDALQYELNDPSRRKLAFLVSIGELVSIDEFHPELLPRCQETQRRKIRDTDRLTPAEKRRLRAEVDRLRRRGDVVLLFDGLDMAGDDSVDVLAGILDPDGAWAKCRIVVAGRPFALERHWDRLFARRPWAFVQIAEFDERQQRRALGALPDGRGRFDAIPEEARSILTVPRVLEYIRPLGSDELAKLNTVSDVYWSAAHGMIVRALRTAKSVRKWEPFLALLGAMAFEMYSRTERHGETGELRPNIDRIPHARMADFLDAVLEKMRRAVAGYTDDRFEEELKELNSLNALMNHGWLDTRAVGEGADLLWRNASLQEFFAAYWACRWGGNDEAGHLRQWLVNPVTGGNRAFSWFWRYTTEMPDEVVRPDGRSPLASWQAVLALLYARPADGTPPVRSTEFLFRSWKRMRGTDPQRGFLAEFPGLKASSPVARRMWDGFRPIPEGTFRMGSPDTDKDAYRDEKPQHDVSVPAFEMHQFCVTNEEYELFDSCHADHRWRSDNGKVVKHPLAASGETRADDRCPVVNVSWYDAWCFAAWAGAALPTEAQWERAARGGRDTKYWSGDTEADLARVGWYGKNSKSRTHVVGERGEDHPYGLFDIHGNVWEWCRDWYGAYPEAAQSDPRGPSTGSRRVSRGGSWWISAWFCRAALRCWYGPVIRFDFLGFRLALVPPSGSGQ